MTQILIVGASRGIGLELVRQFCDAGAHVTATVRSEEGRTRVQQLGAKALMVDVAQAASASGLAWQIDGERFDTVIINAGAYGPERNALDAPTAEEFDAVMHTNVLGAMRMLPQVAEALAPGARLAVVSSRMGSIGMRTNGHAWLYRASKAALNSVLRDAAFALQGRATCVALHPGWVRTDMGGPDADLDVATSAADIRRVLASLSPAQHGAFLNHDGQALAW